MTGLRDTTLMQLPSVIDKRACSYLLSVFSTDCQRDSRSCRPDWPAADYVLIAKGKLVNRYGDFGLARRSLQVIICYCQYRCILRAKKSAAGGIGESKIDGFGRLINGIVDDRNRKRFDNLARCKTQRA
jgi:hypothetical protein